MGQDPIVSKLNSIERKLDVLIARLETFMQKEKRSEQSPQPRAEQQMKSFTDRAKHVIAKYPGRCKICGNAIEVGDPIIFESGVGAAHQSCV
ncbi:MAG: hypothetical protein ACUVTL_07725 [Thermoproteota archaeon]